MVRLNEIVWGTWYGARGSFSTCDKPLIKIDRERERERERREVKPHSI